MRSAALILASLATATPLDIQERQACPEIHVFGARETTAPPGYGTSQGLVQMVQQAYPGTTAEAITYPACGGQSSCGGASYDSSAQQGTSAVVSAVGNLNKRCPDTKIVLIGYSQVRYGIVYVPRDKPLLGLLTNIFATHPYRGGRLWTMPSAAAPVTPSPEPPSTLSRPPSSWATRTMSQGCLTMLAHALLEG